MIDGSCGFERIPTRTVVLEGEMDPLYRAYNIIDDYCDDLRRKGRKERSLLEYRYRLRMVFRMLSDGNREVNPKKVSSTEITWLLAVPLAGKSTKYRHHTIQILGKFLRMAAGNNVVNDMDLLWPKAQRVVTWISPEQYLYILDSTDGMDKLIVHLAGMMGLRCEEIANLKLSGLRNPWMYVYGKGHMEGKFARIYYHEDTQRLIDEWMPRRTAIVEEHLRRHPEIPVPDNLLLHNWKTDGIATPYSHKSLGNRMIRLSKELGIEFSMHTFRRSHATFLKNSGVPIEDIKEFMRHENIQTTLQYIADDPTRMIRAREMERNYEESIRRRHRND